MNFPELSNQLIKDFNLTSLSQEDREEMLLEISKTIQKQFLFDVYDAIGEKDFDALQASANMGEEFYATTLKHLVPNSDEILQGAKAKVSKAFNADIA
jgi:hypothetical protein